jgi:hypothetical protein
VGGDDDPGNEQEQQDDGDERRGPREEPARVEAEEDERGAGQQKQGRVAQPFELRDGCS